MGDVQKSLVGASEVLDNRSKLIVRLSLCTKRDNSLAVGPPYTDTAVENIVSCCWDCTILTVL